MKEECEIERDRCREPYIGDWHYNNRNLFNLILQTATFNGEVCYNNAEEIENLFESGLRIETTPRCLLEDAS